MNPEIITQRLDSLEASIQALKDSDISTETMISELKDAIEVLNNADSLKIARIEELASKVEQGLEALKQSDTEQIEKVRILEKSLPKLTQRNAQKLDRQTVIILGGFASLIFLITSLNIRTEEKLEYIDKITDHFLEVAAFVITGGTAITALSMHNKKNNSDGHDE